jgi:hypothetical protein
MSRTLAAVAVLLACAVAQEPARERAFGEVRGSDGKPFAGATVTLLHRAHPGVLAPAYEDRVEAVTDERGRFHAQLLVGMPYAVWATGPVTGDTYRCTRVLADVLPGVPIVLVEDGLHHVRKLSVEVDPSWPRPLRFEARASIAGMSVRAPLAEVDGVQRTPAWPASACGVYALDGGLRVWSQIVPMTLTSLRERQSGDAAARPDDAALLQILAGNTGLRVPPRSEYVLKLVDASKQPAAGVELFGDREPRERLGVTGADGVLRVGLAQADRFPYYEVTARAEAFAESRVEQDRFANGGEASPHELEPGVAVRGRLLLAEGRPAGRTTLLLNASIRTGDNSTYFGVGERVLEAAADGAFVVPGRVAGYGFRVTALLTPAQRAALSPRKPAADESAPPLGPRAIVRFESAEAPADLGELRLDQLAPVDVRVRAADGSPPGPVQLVVLPVTARDGNPPHYPERMRTDRHGGLRFLCAPGQDVAVFALTAQGAALGIASQAKRKLDLAIDPRHVARLRILGGDGEPLAGATVDLVAPQASASDGDEARVGNHVRDVYFVHGFPFKNGLTDADGRVTLVVPLQQAKLDLAIYVRDQDTRRSMRLDVPFPFAGGDDPHEIQFVANSR